MGTQVGKIPAEDFRRELYRFWCSSGLVSVETDSKQPSVDFESCFQKLWIHFEELRVWNPKLSLIGPGTSSEVVERHYGESLVAASLFDGSEKRLLDIGSGGGFPGLILSAAFPELECVLVEPRQKKWAFLRSVIRKADLLSCRVLNARVEIPLSQSLDVFEDLDVITSRALSLPHELLAELLSTFPNVRLLLWVGKEEVELPSSARVCRRIDLAGSDHRHIVEIVAKE